MFEMSADISKLATALHAAQGAMTGVLRDGKNPAFRSRYATLENVIDTARPALQKAGLAWVQAPGAVTESGLAVTTMLMHGESGQWIRSTLHVPLLKRDAQAVGSATTYGLRYSLMAMLGLPPTDDDDGNAASAPAPQAEPAPKSSAQLKREDAWKPIIDGLRDDLVDVRTKVGLDRLKDDYRARAKSERWPPAWTAALANEFDNHEQTLLEDTFPGDR